MIFDREKLKNRFIKDFAIEEEEQEDGSVEQRIKINLPVRIVVILVLLSVGAFVFYALHSDKFAISQVQNGDTPLIRADKKPVREKPEDPGGMYIEHQDKAVFNTLKGKKNNELPKVTRILPRPEKPMSREKIVEKAKKQNLEKPKSKTKAEVKKSKIEPIDPIAELQKSESKSKKDKIKDEEKTIKNQKELKEAKEREIVDLSKNKVFSRKVTKDIVKTIPVPIRKSLPKPKLEAKPVKTSKIQLGAFRSEADVLATWNRLKKKYPSILDGLVYSTQKADLGSKGIFYRLHAGPFKNESEGRKICQKLIDKKQGCFFVK